MPTTKPRRKPKMKPQAAPVPPGDVLTLAEAAAYLRLDEAAVLSAVREQQLPARQINGEWRLFKGALNEWLSQSSTSLKEAQLATIGIWDDPAEVEEFLREVYRQRGRPMTEDGP